MLGGAAGVSLCGIVLEWRLTAHGVSLATGVAPCTHHRVRRDVLMLTLLCLLALVAAWQLRAPKPD